MPTIFLGLGTNLGDRTSNLRNAVTALNGVAQVRALSQVYETAPLYVTDQPSFYNMALHAETALPPLELLDRLKDLEQQIGRTQTFRYGPRVIDLDILIYDDLIMESDRLTIPHPRLHERRFALAPLADVAAQWIHPQLGRTIAQLFDALPADTDDIRVMATTLFKD